MSTQILFKSKINKNISKSELITIIDELNQYHFKTSLYPITKGGLLLLDDCMNKRNSGIIWPWIYENTQDEWRELRDDILFPIGLAGSMKFFYNNSDPWTNNEIKIIKVSIQMVN